MKKYVLTEGRPYGIEQNHDVVERFDFGPYGGALVETFGEVDREDVVDVDGETKFHTRIADVSYDSEQPTATIEDVRELQDVPREGATGEGVHVVVMDSGVDDSHPVFDDVEVRHVDVTGTGTDDVVGHGTASAGQIARLAPDVTITSLKIFPDEQRTSMRYIYRAYQWLLQRTDQFDVVNMSWGSGQQVRTINRLQNLLVKRGVRDTTAAGNSGGRGGSPATAERAFAIGACTESGEMATFSSYNPKENPEVVALGEQTRLARASGTSLGKPVSERWTVASGTSFAAPALAGMTARYLERNGDAAPARVTDDFVANAHNIEGTPRDRHGIADYTATVGEIGGGDGGTDGSKDGNEGDEKQPDSPEGDGTEEQRPGRGDGREGQRPDDGRADEPDRQPSDGQDEAFCGWCRPEEDVHCPCCPDFEEPLRS